MSYPRVGHFWRNPVVLSFGAVMATAATITFAWRDTKSPGDLVELREAAVGKTFAAGGPPTTASKYMYAVRDAAGFPKPTTAQPQLESVVAFGDTGTAVALGSAPAAGPSSNRFGFSGSGSSFQPRTSRTSTGSGGGGSAGGIGGGGWGGVSGTAAAVEKPAAAARAPRPERAAKPEPAPREPRPPRNSPAPRASSGGGGSSQSPASSSSSGSEIVSAPAASPAVTATFGTPAAPVVAAVAGGARGLAVAGVAGGAGGTVRPSVTPSATPEPMSLIMIGTGLAGAFGLRRRLKR